MVGRRLNNEGVDYLLMKGPTLDYLVGEGTRSFTDVDIIVRVHDLKRVLDLMRLDNLQPISTGMAADGAINLAGDRLGELVDLHWTIKWSSLPSEKVFEEMWSTRQAMTVAGVQLHTYSWEMSAMHVVVHAAQHGPTRPSAVADLQRLLQLPAVDWPSLCKLAMAVGLGQRFGIGLRLLPAGRAMARQLGLRRSPIFWQLHARRVRGLRGLVSLWRYGTGRNAALPPGVSVDFVPAETIGWLAG